MLPSTPQAGCQDVSKEASLEESDFLLSSSRELLFTLLLRSSNAIRNGVLLAIVCLEGIGWSIYLHCV